MPYSDMLHTGAMKSRAGEKGKRKDEKGAMRRSEYCRCPVARKLPSPVPRLIAWPEDCRTIIASTNWAGRFVYERAWR